MLNQLIKAIKKIYQFYVVPQKNVYGQRGASAKVEIPALLIGPQNLFLEDNVVIGPFSVIFSPHSSVRFKRFSYTGPNLFISTGDHCFTKVGRYSMTVDYKEASLEGKANRNVIVEEDVWIGANVTVLCEVIGRGAIVAAGSLLKNNVLPYTIVGGVPAKCIKLRFTKEEILSHERQLYKEEERLSENQIDEIISNINSFKNEI